MNSNKNDEQKPKLTPKQKELMKKIFVFTLMGVICAGCLYWIYVPSKASNAEKEQSGFNTDIPLPKEGDLIGDKRDAYEKEFLKQKQSERMRSLQDFSSLFGDSTSKKNDELALTTDGVASSSGLLKREETSPMQNSVNAYRDINRSLGNFYEKPQKDTEKEELKRQIEELQSRVDKSENRNDAEEKQIRLMEKSMQMAAKYMPGAVGSPAVPAVPAKELPTAAKENTFNKPQVVQIATVRKTAVSMLQPEMTNAEFIETFSQPRNMGFLTVASDTAVLVKNTIMACIHSDQTLMDGQSVRLRLLEPMKAGNIVIPQGTVMSGFSKIEGERMQITVTALEYGGMIITVNLKAYDTDGQQGIFIPNLQELSAVKEIIANMGTSMGMNINLSSDAGSQLAADMGRNAMQGVSQYMGKKLREVKVHLKAGYLIFLMPEKNNN